MVLCQNRAYGNLLFYLSKQQLINKTIYICIFIYMSVAFLAQGDTMDEPWFARREAARSYAIACERAARDVEQPFVPPASMARDLSAEGAFACIYIYIYMCFCFVFKFIL